MDVPTAITPTQSLLLWTLLGFLLAWMLLFALLAVRPETKKKVELEEVSLAPAQPITTPVPRILQTVTPQPDNYVPTAAGSMSHETPVMLEKSQ